MLNLKYLFDRYGQDFTLHNGSTTHEYRAFIQPLRYKNKMYLRGIHTDLGLDMESNYLYIGPADYSISNIDMTVNRLSSGETFYRIDKTETVMIGDTKAYIWAIIRPITPYNPILSQWRE